MPSGAADLPGFEYPPIVWLQLTSYHSSLSPYSPSILVLPISSNFVPFLLCIFDFICLHLLSLSTLLLLHCVSASSMGFSFSSVLPLIPSLPLSSLFFQPTFFLPNILYPGKPSCLPFPVFVYQCFLFPIKGLHSTTRGRLNYSYRAQKTFFFTMFLLVQPGKLACLFVQEFGFGLGLGFLNRYKAFKSIFFNDLCDAREKYASLCPKLTHCPMLHFYKIYSEMLWAQIMT